MLIALVPIVGSQIAFCTNWHASKSIEENAPVSPRDAGVSCSAASTQGQRSETLVSNPRRQ